MWICPNCKKKFRNANQSHSCSRIEIDEHFINKPPVLKAAFDKLMKKVESFGEITVNSVRSSITVKSGAAFLGVKPKKDSLEIEFYLNYELKDDMVKKILVMSKNRIVHYVTVNDPSEINSKLIALILKSYKLITKK